MTLLVVCFGYDAQDDIIGAVVGHLYYYIVDIIPKIPETRDLKLLKAPSFLEKFCDFFKIGELSEWLGGK